jgi:site-specific recombinase XerD
MRLSDGLNYYKTCARAEGKSPATILWMQECVRHFSDFLGADVELDKVTCDDLRAFISALMAKKAFSGHRLTPTQERGLSPATVANRTRAIRTLFSFLEGEEMIPNNPMRKVKVPKTTIKQMPVFSERELEKLMSQPNKKTDAGYRDYVVMLTLLDTAVRVSELVGVTMDDVDLETGELRVMGKGAKERFSPIGAKLSKALLKYKLIHRPREAGTNRFFVTRDGRPLCRKRIQTFVKEYGQRAGITKTRCSPHTFRSTSTVVFLRNGGGEFAAQARLGHSTLTMTRRYAAISRDDVKAQHLKFGVADGLRV